MSNFSNRDELVIPIATFVLGLGTKFLFDHIIDQFNNKNTLNAIILLMILLCLAILTALFKIILRKISSLNRLLEPDGYFHNSHKSTREKIDEYHNLTHEKLDNFHGVRVEYFADGDKGYIESLNRVKSAKDSILVIGDYSPDNFHLELPEERKPYLEEIVSKLRKINSNGQKKFVYSRIVQREHEVYQEIRKREKRDGTLVLSTEDMIGDEQILGHCKQVLDIKREKINRDLEISVKACVSIPNCPSILIIDKRFLLFTLPRADYPNKYETDGVLIFEDLCEGRAIINSFISIFNTLKEFSKSVSDIDIKPNFRRS